MNTLLQTATSHWPAIALAAAFTASVQTPPQVLRLAKRKFKRGSRADLWNNILSPNSGFQPPSICRLCQGEGIYPCETCSQTGSLARGGFSRHNTVRIPSLVGSKWTSVSPIDGKWRHFLCVGKRGSNAKNGIAVLSSTCGPVENRIRLEIPVKQLKSRELWEGGWTTLNDIHAGSDLPNTVCSACNGMKVIPCPRCDGAGQVGM